MLDTDIRESGAEVTNDPLPSVRFDFAQLTQLFRQLITNSIMFRSPNRLPIHISATDTGDAIQFSVRDNGIGIDPRYHEQIFGRLQASVWPRISRHGHRFGHLQTHRRSARRRNLGGIRMPAKVLPFTSPSQSKHHRSA